MARKKKKVERREPEPPKFSGFKPLAAGLGDLKAKIAEEEGAAAREPARPPAPRPAAQPERTPEGDREDELAFHRMMSGVTPLAGRGSRVPVAGAARIEPGKTKPADLAARTREEASAVLDRLHQLVDDPVRFEVTDDGKRVEGRRQDVPPALVRELRRGVLPIDARLDLHGLRAEAARGALVDFLRAQRARGERCVLVIHGKGEHSIAGAVLRGEISAWLSQGRAREHVAAFATARDDDGGEGAVYVALRR